jgi:hypothetical protein
LSTVVDILGTLHPVYISQGAAGQTKNTQPAGAMNRARRNGAVKKVQLKGMKHAIEESGIPWPNQADGEAEAVTELITVFGVDGRAT